MSCSVSAPLCRPFQGIFPEPQAAIAVVDLAALLAILFFLLIRALVVAIARAIAARPA